MPHNALPILEYLRKHGQRLDSEIAKGTGMPLAEVRQRLTGLAETNAIVMCKLTRFPGGKPVEAWECRVSGYSPPAAPGRKAKADTAS